MKYSFDIRAPIDRLLYEHFDAFVESHVTTIEAQIAAMTLNK